MRNVADKIISVIWSRHCKNHRQPCCKTCFRNTFRCSQRSLSIFSLKLLTEVLVCQSVSILPSNTGWLPFHNAKSISANLQCSHTKPIGWRDSTVSYVEWKRNLVAHGDAREEKWRGKRRMEWVAKQASVWLGTVHPVLLQSFSADPHSKKASTRLNWHPRRYKWTRPFRWKTESGFCACAITFRFHSTTNSTNVGPCKITTRMLKPTADQKTRIALNIIVSQTWHLSCVKYKQDRKQYCNQIHHFDSRKQNKVILPMRR